MTVLHPSVVDEGLVVVNVSPVLRYTLLRSALFAVVLAVLALLGVRGLLLLFLAVLVSGLASYSLLSRQRDAVSRSVDDRVRRVRANMHERTGAEDAADDLARGTPTDAAGTATRTDPVGLAGSRPSSPRTDEAAPAADEAVTEDLRGDRHSRE